MEPPLRIHFEADGLSLETADTIGVLRVLTAYLVALNTIAVRAGAAGVDLALPQYASGSVDVVTAPRANAQSVLSYAEELASLLTHPHSAATGLKTVLGGVLEAVAEMDESVRITAFTGGVPQDLTALARHEAAPRVRSLETLRAKIIGVGGTERAPRVTFESHAEARRFSLRATPQDTRSAAALLWQIVDVEADVVRALLPRQCPIASGWVVGLRELPMGSSVAAWDAWYKAAGRPWGDVDLEADESMGQRSAGR